MEEIWGGCQKITFFPNFTGSKHQENGHFKCLARTDYKFLEGKDALSLLFVCTEPRAALTHGAQEVWKPVFAWFQMRAASRALGTQWHEL